MNEPTAKELALAAVALLILFLTEPIGEALF